MGSGKKLIWLGVAAVIVPLSVLLALQFRWLSTLERTSTLAHRTSLDAFLTDVSNASGDFAPVAEQLLSVPVAAFSAGKEGLAEAHFRANLRPGFRQPFLFWLDKTKGDGLRVLSLESNRFLQAEEPARQWVAMATSHLALLGEKAVPLDDPELWVDERDPSHRMVLLPRTNLTGRVVGVAGVELDEKAFLESTLPKHINRALATHFSDDMRDDLIVWVQTDDGRTVFGNPEPAKGHDERTVTFPFVFRDLKLSVKNREYTPAQLARFNFNINVAVGLAVAGVLVAGIFLTLRGTSRELRLSQMKSDFVSNVSHELKTPLASIRLFGELLRSGRVSSPEKVREYGELIETEGRRLSQLIANILDFARIESAQRPYARTQLDLGALVQDTLERFQVAVKHEGFVIDYQRPPEAVNVVGDSAALGQAVYNLVDNALKYSKDVRRLAVEVSQQQEHAVLVVTDHGIGIPAEEHEKIFERFHRVSTGLVHAVRGSGLGLSIVKHVVDAHQGRIEVASEVGKGSRFTVRLPASGTEERRS